MSVGVSRFFFLSSVKEAFVAWLCCLIVSMMWECEDISADPYSEYKLILDLMHLFLG